MAAAPSLPTLSQIENLDTRHLAALDADFTAQAERIENSFTQAHEHLKAAPWEGEAADAALQRTDTDRVKARAHAEELREIAAIARNGEAELRAAQRSVLSPADEARQAGFDVTEGLSVSAYTSGRRGVEAMQLQPRANELAAEIRAHAATLVSIDQNLATKLTAGTAAMNSLSFTESPLFVGGPFPRDSFGTPLHQWTDKDLYPHEPTAADIHQDRIGDCYLDSTMGAIANANPQWIKDRIHYDDKTGTFDVTLWDGHQWKHIPITQDDINTDIAETGASWIDNGQPNAPLWPAVLESGYAKLKYPDQSLADALRNKTGIGQGGYARDAMEALTGNRGTSSDPQQVWYTRQHIDQEIASALANHQPVTISTTPDGVPLQKSHVYVVEDISGTGSDAQVTLRNPWEHNIGTPMNTPEPLVKVRLGDLIGSGATGMLENGPLGTHPMSNVNIGNLG